MKKNLDFWLKTYHKLSDAWKVCCDLPKFKQRGQTLGYFILKDGHEIANSETPDLTALLGAVWSGSALFA